MADNEKTTEKKVLVLGGGGSKGAYQAGAIDYLLGEQGFRYRGIFGVSVGAINGLHLSQYKDFEAAQATEQLLTFWRGISTDQVYKDWFLGKIRGLCKPSFYDSRPLKKYLSEHFSIEKFKNSGKAFGVGAVSMDTGEYRLFTEDYEDILNAVLASAAYPVMFLTVPLENQQWSDGGIRSVTPLKAAFDYGATEMHVIMCTPANRTFSAKDKPNAIDNLSRMMDIMLEEIIETDLKLALAYNKLAKHGLIPGKRHAKIRVIRPEKSLPGSSLDFDHHIEEKIKIGYEDAKRVFG